MTGWRYLHVLWVVGFACSFELDLEENAARPTIAFEYTNSGADELSGTVMIPVILTAASTVEVRVNYSLLGGSGALDTWNEGVAGGHEAASVTLRARS